MNLPIAQVIQGEGFIFGILTLVVIGLAFWLLWWLVEKLELPEPVGKVCKSVLLIAVVIVLINALFSLIGKGFIQW